MDVEQQRAFFQDACLLLFGGDAVASLRGAEGVSVGDAEFAQLGVECSAVAGNGPAQIDKTDEVMAAHWAVDSLEGCVKSSGKIAGRRGRRGSFGERGSWVALNVWEHEIVFFAANPQPAHAGRW